MDLGADLKRAFFIINENKIITDNICPDNLLDLFTSEAEYKNLMYPVWRKGFD